MRIKRLQLKNLNSLAGEWEIDFTQPEYESEGLFLIAGQTGAGKTTLLDAICLALYGQTPRLGKITKSGNEIMSRQTGECSAELDFETSAGVFRCHWSQRRARGNAEGALQAPKHEISEMTTGKVIEGMLSKVVPEVEKICGLDMERFTRSIMLAQGEFSKFLQSTADERSPILEQITGTKIYSEISQQVHLRRVVEDGKMKELTDQMSSIQILGADEVTKLEAEFTQLKSTVTQKKAELDKLHQAQHWLQTIDKESALIKQTKQEIQEHAQEVARFSNNESILKLATLAHEIEPVYWNWKGTQQEQRKVDATIKNLSSVGAEKEKIHQEAFTLTEKSKQVTETAKQERKALEPKLTEASKIHTRVEEEKERTDNQRQKFKQLNTQLKGSKKQLQDFSDQQAKLSSQHKVAETYLRDNASHSRLIEELSGMERIAQSWSEYAAQNDKSQGVVSKLGLEIKQGSEQLTVNQAQLQKAVDQSAVLEKNEQLKKRGLEKLLDGESELDIERRLNALQKKRILSLEQLEQFRASLTEGEPCAVCGSVEHPHKHLEAPAEDEIVQAIAAIEATRKSISAVQKELTQFTLDKERQNSVIKNLETGIKTAQKQITEQQEQLKEEQHEVKQLQTKMLNLKQEMNNTLKQCAPKTALCEDPQSVKKIIIELTKKSETWKKYADSLTHFNEQKVSIAAALKAEQKVSEDLQLRLKQIEEEGKASVKKLKGFEQQLRDLIGDTTIAALKEKSDEKLATTEKAYQLQNQKREQIKGELAALKARLAENQTLYTELEAKLAKHSEMYLTALAAKGFSDEKAFTEARLEEEQRQHLEQQSKVLKLKQQTLQNRLADTEERYKKESAKELTKLDLPVLQESIKILSTEYESIFSTFGAIQQKLLDHQSANKTLEKKLKDSAKQEKECQRWSRLHGLIGSSDGKKFRNFAQGLTFEVMVNHANEQLQKMSDRYMLIRDHDAPLELSVIDSYQAGEIRSTKNLSGGESFIVSLALALGLSKMASKNIQVDSLFLDEGFGTLDEEALETALDTLATMNQEGKIIGIISHIASLKERISTQLRLVRSSHGTSSIEGPGVRKITR